MQNTIIYPGSFDPPTNGHIDLVNRALEIFDSMIVAVINNPSKAVLFSAEERVNLLNDIFSGNERVSVENFDGLLVDFASTRQANTVLRGLRAVSDFEYEFQMAMMNRKLDPKLHTVYLMPSQEFSFISSSLIKEVYSLGGNVSDLVHPAVEKGLRNKLKNSG